MASEDSGLIQQTIEAMLGSDKSWTFNQLCVDALSGKKERLRQMIKNKKRYEKDKQLLLEAKMKASSVVQEFQ
jgi:hypothetical protein